MQWKCVCGEWVDVKHPAHTHAAIREVYDDATKKWEKTIGQPPEIWTFERTPDRETRQS